MKKTQTDKPMEKKRVLARVVAEDLAQVNGGRFHTFTQAPPPIDFDLD